MSTVQFQRGQRLYFYSHNQRRPPHTLMKRAQAAGFVLVDAGADADVAITSNAYARKIMSIYFWNNGRHETPVAGADRLRAQIAQWRAQDREARQRERAERIAKQAVERKHNALRRHECAALRRQHRLVGACRTSRSRYAIGF